MACANPVNSDNLKHQRSFGTMLTLLISCTSCQQLISNYKIKSLPYGNLTQAMISVRISIPTVLLAVLGSLSRHQSLSPACHCDICLAGSLGLLRWILSVFQLNRTSTLQAMLYGSYTAVKAWRDRLAASNEVITVTKIEDWLWLSHDISALILWMVTAQDL